jgi:hypothetical protein
MVSALNAYEKGRSMQIMGTNRWDRDMDPRMLVARALEFADMVKQQGIAELHGAWIAEDERLMWCSWDTDDVPALQAAFDEMNRQSGLTSELMDVKTFYSTIQETASV